MKVEIPFLARFKEPMLKGTKTMTSRTRKYGNAGDTFDAFGATFQITEVGKMQLGNIAFLWKEEGMESIFDFVKTWGQIHPQRFYDVDEWFYYHRFRKVKE